MNSSLAIEALPYLVVILSSFALRVVFNLPCEAVNRWDKHRTRLCQEIDTPVGREAGREGREEARKRGGGGVKS